MKSRIALLAAVLWSVAPAAYAQGVTNPANNPYPVEVTIDGQTFTDGRDTLPGYDDVACTPIPGVQYDFAEGLVKYYDGDGKLLKTAKWSEWARISSYQDWVNDQKTPTPTATAAPTQAPATSAPAESTAPSPSPAAAGGGSAPSTTTASTPRTTSPSSRTPTTRTQPTRTQTGKSQPAKTQAGKGEATRSATTGGGTSTTSRPSTSTSTGSGSSAASSGGSGSSSAGGGSSSPATSGASPSTSSSAAGSGAAPATDAGAAAPTVDPVSGEVVDAAGPAEAALVAPDGTVQAPAGGGTPVAGAKAGAAKFKLASQTTGGVPDTRLAGIGILVALVALGCFCLAFGEVRQTLFGRRKRAGAPRW